jgi:hypothetical protein
VTAIQKTVRFYQPVITDEKDVEYDISAGFWSGLGKVIQAASLADRTSTFNGVTYSGSAHTAKVPATRYLKVGRQRPPGEFPETIDLSTGDEGSLSIGLLHLLESAWMVPMGGRRNTVAIMSPLVGLVGVSAIERWLTTVTGATQKGESIELRPIIDTAVLHKLNAVARGVSKLKVRIPAHESVTVPRVRGRFRSKVEESIEEATRETTDELSVELTWSFGRARPSEGQSKVLLRAAQALSKLAGPDVLEVNMMIPEGDADSYRVEQHNLLFDRITAAVRIERRADSQPDEASVLTAINGAIRQYRGQPSQ